jgi:hypothetical protein
MGEKPYLIGVLSESSKRTDYYLIYTKTGKDAEKLIQNKLGLSDEELKKDYTFIMNNTFDKEGNVML